MILLCTNNINLYVYIILHTSYYTFNHLIPNIFLIHFKKKSILWFWRFWKQLFFSHLPSHSNSNFYSLTFHWFVFDFNSQSIWFIHIFISTFSMRNFTFWCFSNKLPESYYIFIRFLINLLRFINHKFAFLISLYFFR